MEEAAAGEGEEGEGGAGEGGGDFALQLRQEELKGEGRGRHEMMSPGRRIAKGDWRKLGVMYSKADWLEGRRWRELVGVRKGEDG